MTENSDTVSVELKDVASRNDINDSSGDTSIRTNVSFLLFLAAVQIVGLTLIFLLIYWTYSYADGFGFSNQNVFNWHPLLLTIALVYLNGNGILVKQLSPNLSTNAIKTTLIVNKGLILVLIAIGGWAVYHYHNVFLLNHMYSIHSWLGLMTIIIFGIQAIVELSAPVYPAFYSKIIMKTRPYYNYLYLSMFLLAIVCVLTGVNEKAVYKLKKTYRQFRPEGNVLNLIGMLTALFGLIIAYSTLRPHP